MKIFSRWTSRVGVAVAGGAIAVAIAACGSTTSTRTVTAPSAQTTSSGQSVPASIQTSSGLSINQIYREDGPGVVDIIVTSQSSSPSFGFFGGGGSSQTQEGEGAGIVYNSQGYILTDEHVVANAISVKVNFQDGKSYSAKVIGTDPSTDVGVIKINAPASELHPLPLANSSTAQVGDPVVAIGSPFSLPETVTQGIVSQTGRGIQAPNGYTIPGAIQTDAAINPGNSGGPLIAANGRVLGLNDQIETNNTNGSGQGSSSGIGFATPINTDVQVANEIIAGKKPAHAYVGVSLPGGLTSPATISSVQSGSPAASAGLTAGDTITAIDGRATPTANEFIAIISQYTPGQTVTFTVEHSGQTKKVQVKLGDRPASTPSASSATAP
jgi:putative serine protease PepD